MTIAQDTEVLFEIELEAINKALKTSNRGNKIDYSYRSHVTSGFTIPSSNLSSFLPSSIFYKLDTKFWL